jgi:hypothetical protein
MSWIERPLKGQEGSGSMAEPLQAFLGGIIDYAGLFPPARLPLDEALRNYARYASEPESWLLGRFVLPAGKLDEATPLVQQLFAGPTPCRFAVLGRGGNTSQDFFAGVKQDMADVGRFRDILGERVVVDVYEAKLPASAFNPVKDNQLSALVATTAFLIETAGPPVLSPFFESPVVDRTTLLAVIQALHDDHLSTEAQNRRRCQLPGCKLRTGGLEASAFPSVELVAVALAACQAARVPFKATAGLHHPIRRFDQEIQTTMHGFLNVFGAGCLAYAHPMSASQLQEIIADEQPGNFSLDQDGFRWKERRAATTIVAEARRTFVTSFGSCSFDEPRQDLRQMKWLP